MTLPALIPLGDWLAATGELENTCPDPGCKDYHDHAPAMSASFPQPVRPPSPKETTDAVRRS